MKMEPVYENEGYCPGRRLDFKMEYSQDVSEKSKLAIQILGDRKAYVMYSGFERAYEESYFVEVMTNNGESTLGIELATLIKVIFPNCKFPESKIKIVCHDTINPWGIPDLEMDYEHKKWKMKYGIMLEDESFLFVMKRSGEKQLDLYFYKK